VEDEELDAIKVESTRTIDIDSFVPRKEIDPAYIDAPYYIAQRNLLRSARVSSALSRKIFVVVYYSRTWQKFTARSALEFGSFAKVGGPDLRAM
jgi:hypothetical protein